MHYTKEEFREIGFKVCQGWAAERRDLNKKGYFSKNRMVKRGVAQAGLDNLHLMIDQTMDREDRDDAAKNLRAILKMLWRSAGFKWKYLPRTVADCLKKSDKI